MAWALVKHWNNNSIFKQAPRKYDLLKWMETKEHISKKTIKNFQDGDKITVIFRKSYMKWFRSEDTGRLYQDRVDEANEVTYTLREVETVFKNSRRRDG
ncbi:hypothetical protein AAXE64_08095 [Priestia megaterium]